MNFFALIASVIFLGIAALAALVGSRFGRKYKWELSLGRIAAVVVSAIISALLSALISNLAIGSLAESLLSGSALGSIGDMLNELSIGLAALSAFVSMLVAPIIFIPLFIIIRMIINAIAKLIVKRILAVVDRKGKHPAKTKKYVTRKRYKRKDEHLVAHHVNPLGGALGAVCSVLVLIVFFIPFAGALELADGVASIALYSAEQSDETNTASVIVAAVDGAANNAGTLSVKLTGGKLLYGLMTTSSVDGETANLNKESALAASVADALISFSSDNILHSKKAEAIRKVSPAFDKSIVIRFLVTDICSEAGEDWNEGRAYYGIKRPFINNDLKPITDSIVDVLATSDKENIKSDFKAIVEAAAIVVEDGLADDLNNNAMHILSREDTTSRLFGALLEDERLDPLVDGVADFGVSMLMNSVNAPLNTSDRYEAFVSDFEAVRGDDREELTAAYALVFENYAVREDIEVAENAADAYLSGENMGRWVRSNVISDENAFAEKTELISKTMITTGAAPITDREHEADALAHAFAIVYGMTADIKNDAFVAKRMLATMGPALDSFAQTETIGRDKTSLMLRAIMQSNLVHDQIGFSTLEATDSAISISENSSNKSYTSIMTSLSGVIEMLEAASDKTKNTKEAVDRMLSDLTPEAATVMQTMSTPSVMRNYGVPEKSADASASMMKSTFANLKEVPSSEYNKESAAVANMMSIMMSIPNSTAPSVFGGEDSATQMTEEEYVNNITESTAMSASVVETVYGDGNEPKNDPLSSNRNLSDSEKSNLVSSLDAKWQASEKDEETRRELISIAAMMNLPVDVVNGSVAVVSIEE